MKAILLDKHGPASNLRLGELPDPEARAGEVLVEVEASSVNPLDTRIRSGALAAIGPELPSALHGDVVGTIKALGEGVEGWRIGDRVWACGGGVKGSDGALAQLMRIDARLAAHAPDSLSSAEAAALPLVGITAWQAVVERGQAGLGRSVLVHGATGGVGHVALQLARLAGSQVTASVSTEAKAETAKQLGADDVHIGRDAPEDEYDIVIDTIGGENVARSMRQIATHGRVVTIAARTNADLSPMHAKAASLHVVFMLLPLLTGKGRDEHGSILSKLAALVDGGRVKPLIADRFAFADAAKAHEVLEGGKHIGKIVLSGW